MSRASRPSINEVISIPETVFFSSKGLSGNSTLQAPSGVVHRCQLFGWVRSAMRSMPVTPWNKPNSTRNGPIHLRCLPKRWYHSSYFGLRPDFLPTTRKPRSVAQTPPRKGIAPSTSAAMVSGLTCAPPALQTPEPRREHDHEPDERLADEPELPRLVSDRDLGVLRHDRSLLARGDPIPFESGQEEVVKLRHLRCRDSLLVRPEELRDLDAVLLGRDGGKEVSIHLRAGQRWST